MENSSDALSNIQDRLIGKILASQNTDFLTAVENLFNSIKTEKKSIPIDNAQVQMLNMSEQDIQNGDLISEDELDKLDNEWLD